MPASTSGKPGASLAPGREALVVVAPVLVARPYVLGETRCAASSWWLKSRQQSWRTNGSEPFVAERSRNHLAGGDTAEVEVRRESRGRVRGKVVGELAVAREPVAEPLLEPAPPRGLAADRELRGKLVWIELDRKALLEAVRERDPLRAKCWRGCSRQRRQ